MRYAMAIDTRKCVGCSDCVVACQTENNVPVGYCRDWVIEINDGTYPELEMEIRSERCNHCDNAPCVRCCPTGASHIVRRRNQFWSNIMNASDAEPVLHPVLMMPAILIPKDMSINAPSACTGLKRTRTCLCGGLSDQMHLFRRSG